MKRLFVSGLFMMLVSNLFSQATQTTEIEQRAREFFKAISQPEEREWKEFMLKNYTPAFRDKPVKVNIQSSEAPAKAAAATEPADPMESKIAMYERLHKQFGNGKIISLTPAEGEVTMVLQNNAGLNGNFKFLFEKKQPYLIAGLRVEIRD
jgi:hypothetical protein